MNRTALLTFGWTCAALAVFLFCGGLIGLCGHDRTREFSPDTFRTRESEAFYVGPLRLPMASEDKENAVSRYLAAKGYVEASTDEVRWTTVSQIDSYSFACRFPVPAFWVACAVERNECDYLIAWSERHPDLASELWTRFREWAESDRFDVLELALRSGLSDELDSSSLLEERLDGLEREARAE